MEIFMNLNNLRAEEPYRGFLYIKDAQVRSTKNNSKFIKLLLSDTDYKEVTSFLWNATEEDIKDFTQGKIVGVQGKGKLFNDNMQLDIARIRLANEGDSVDISQFIEVAPENAEDMLNEIYQTVDEFTNEDLKKVAKKCLEDRKEKLLYFPAAKSMHHAMKGGLLYHTISMLRMAKAIADLYPFLNKDLLYSGVILHDLGKIDEMLSDQSGNVTDYSREGKLLGHITTQINELGKIGQEFSIDPEIILLLQHMILSHHYEPEFGSPKRPMFPEAEVLHHLDMIDARMNTMNRYRKSIMPGSFSERLTMLNGISLYRPSFDSE